jgi:hypothetical protein
MQGANLRAQIAAATAAAAGWSLAAAPASAGEIFAALARHDVDVGIALCCFERGTDVQLGARSAPIWRPLGGEVRLQAFGSVNLDGGVDFAVAGAVVRWPLGRTLYLQPGLGLAVHNGSGAKAQLTPDRLYLGSRVLLAPEFYAGANLTRSFRVEAGLTHLSHGRLSGRQNPGLDQLAVRAVLRLGG